MPTINKYISKFVFKDSSGIVSRLTVPTVNIGSIESFKRDYVTTKSSQTIEAPKKFTAPDDVLVLESKTANGQTITFKKDGNNVCTVGTVPNNKDNFLISGNNNILDITGFKSVHISNHVDPVTPNDLANKKYVDGVKTLIGNLQSLPTTNKNSIVQAINELHTTAINTIAGGANAKIGRLELLKTVAKTTLSDSINEVFERSLRSDADDTAEGVITFAQAPISSQVPTDNAHLVNKKYVDESCISTGASIVNKVQDALIFKNSTTNIRFYNNDVQNAMISSKPDSFTIEGANSINFLIKGFNTLTIDPKIVINNDIGIAKDIALSPVENAQKTMSLYNSTVGTDCFTNIDLVNKAKIKNVPAPVENGDVTNKEYVDKRILISGSRGVLKGYSTVDVLSGNQVIDKNSNDIFCINSTGSLQLTFVPASVNEQATKVINIKAVGSTILSISGAVWSNKGITPTWGNPGKTLIIVANFIGGRVVLSVFDNDQ